MMNQNNFNAGTTCASACKFIYRFICVACLLVTVSGCTSFVLRKSTESVTYTINTILEQQIADNLALFHGDGIPLPSQMVLGQGAITIQDNISPQFKFPYTNTRSSSKEGDLGASRQWQEAWSVTPVVDADDLLRLQYVYQCAATTTCPRTPDTSIYPSGNGAPMPSSARFPWNLFPAKAWLSFGGCKHDGWRYLGSHHGLKVCVEPKQFARFALLVMQVTVDTQKANSTKGAFLAF